MNDYDVLIVGGGPCGLMSSILLARHGVSSLVVERHPDISIHPKATGVTRRTGEIFRQLGLYERLCGANITSPDHALNNWSRGLAGELLGRTPLVEDGEAFTPCKRIHCPQPHTEAVLARELHTLPNADIWHYHEVTETSETTDGVTLTCVNRSTDEARQVTGRYLIAADGARSPIREKLGIEVDGPGDMGHFINTYFRANYGPHMEDRKAILVASLGEDFAEFFVAVNGQDLWLMHHFLEEGESINDYSEERMTQLIKKASGLPNERVEIISMLPWVMSPKIAKNWRHGRYFLVGDSAARLSPTGGIGMNTGLQSAHNLAWKLASVIRGNAPEALLDTYSSERIEAASLSSESSNSNFMELYAIIECGLRGDWDRAKEKITQYRRAGGMLGLDLGLAYSKGALAPDGTSPVDLEDPINDYQPSGRPGSRAPHFWLNEEKSSLDLFGGGFVVLAGPDGGDWELALNAQEWPLKGGLAAEFHQIDHPDFRELYGVQTDGVILVRPDGYVGARIRSMESSEVHALVDAARQTIGA